jgi:ubiquinone/menaquinone biosynthesis C-methylase UbiE
MQSHPYALGSTASAARRLEIQDRQLAEASEALLDAVALRPGDRVLELGCGAGSFSKRILRRLGPAAAFTGVDYTQGLLDQAARAIEGVGQASRELVAADIRQIGPLAARADVILGRVVLHHLPFPEVLLGQLLPDLRPGTRLGFVEPEFRVQLGRLALLERQGRAEAAPLRRWAEGISRYYQMTGVAPSIGANLAAVLTAAGYGDVHAAWHQGDTSAATIENLTLYYDEIRQKYIELGLMTSDEIDREQRLLAALPLDNLPANWGLHRVTCVV